MKALLAVHYRSRSPRLVFRMAPFYNHKMAALDMYLRCAAHRAAVLRRDLPTVWREDAKAVEFAIRRAREQVIPDSDISAESDSPPPSPLATPALDPDPSRPLALATMKVRKKAAKKGGYDRPRGKRGGTFRQSKVICSKKAKKAVPEEAAKGKK